MQGPPSGMYDALRHDADKQAWVHWLFDHVAPRYDLGNDLMSLGWHTRWKRRLVDLVGLQADHRVLDVSCGTGDVTYLVAPRVREVVGCDLSAEMLREAERKRSAGVANATFVQCDAVKMPFDSASFDRITISYAGRGFSDFPGVLRECWRVLKPGGELWNLDFARPANPVVDAGYRGWLMASGAVLGTVLHGTPRAYMYIPASMAHYRGQHWLADEMRALGFEATVTETTLSLMAFNRGIKPAGPA